MPLHWLLDRRCVGSTDPSRTSAARQTSSLDNGPTNAPTPSLCTVGLTGATWILHLLQCCTVQCTDALKISPVGLTGHLSSAAPEHPMLRPKHRPVVFAWCWFNWCIHSCWFCPTHRGCHFNASNIFYLCFFTMIWTSWQRVGHFDYGLDFIHGT